MGQDATVPVIQKIILTALNYSIVQRFKLLLEINEFKFLYPYRCKICVLFSWHFKWNFLYFWFCLNWNFMSKICLFNLFHLVLFKC